MKAEREVISESKAVEEVDGQEPQSEWGRELLALMKAVDDSGIPKLSVEEIEEYLGRPLGGIAAAFPDGVYRHEKPASAQRYQGTPQVNGLKAEEKIDLVSNVIGGAEAEVDWPEPQTEFGAKLIALAKELDASNTPKLSVEEIEDYLGRKLGGIAAAFPTGVIPRKSQA